VVRAGRRLTLALAFVSADDALRAVVEDLLARRATRGVRVRRLLLDREFASVAVLRFLQAQPVTAIVALPNRGGALKAPWRGRGRLRSTYPRRSAEDGELPFPLWVAVRSAMGRRGKPERESLAFAVVGQAACDRTVRQVAQEYRGRFGIESRYRLLGQGLAPTRSRDPWRRLLLVTVGRLLTHLWVWRKATRLAAPPRRARTAARAWLEHSFRLDRRRDLLIAALNVCYHVPTTLAYPFHRSPTFSLAGGQIGKY
jgi:hypothetical protein